MLLLDTHALVWTQTDDRKLGRKAQRLIDRAWAAGRVAVSAVSFWEIGLLSARGRLSVPAPIDVWRNRLLGGGLAEIPVDGGIALRALDLAGLPDDPMDRMIVASALQQGAELLTADQRLLAWKHSLVRHDAGA